MYNYTFLLTPARNKSDIAFTSYKPLILEAINNINNGLAFKRDCKKIFLDVDNIYDKEITLILSSKNMLTNPSRSLSALTRYLTTYYSETFHPYVYNKTLFNINLLKETEDTKIITTHIRIIRSTLYEELSIRSGWHYILKNYDKLLSK